MCVALLMGPCVLEVGCVITRSAGYLIITEPTYNSHATPIDFSHRSNQEINLNHFLKEGKILENQPIKPHVPLLMLRRAKPVPFLCCQNTPEAECFP